MLGRCFGRERGTGEGDKGRERCLGGERIVLGEYQEVTQESNGTWEE